MIYRCSPWKISNPFFLFFEQTTFFHPVILNLYSLSRFRSSFFVNSIQFLTTLFSFSLFYYIQNCISTQLIKYNSLLFDNRLLNPHCLYDVAYSTTFFFSTKTTRKITRLHDIIPWRI